MDKYQCIACGYIYDPAIGDPDNGVAPGTAFEDLPADWVCPDCGVGKEEFEKIQKKLVEFGIRVSIILFGLLNLIFKKIVPESGTIFYFFAGFFFSRILIDTKRNRV